MATHRLYVGTIGEGLWRSSDGGETFARASGGMFVECLVRALALGYFGLKYTKYGIWLRAVAQNRPMAAALGVPVPRVYILAFVLCSGLAALAGGLLLPLTSVYPTIGSDEILTAFIVVVAGGLGNFRGAAIVALLVGEFESLGSLVLKPSVLEVVLFVLVILLLMARSRRTTALVRL